MLNYLVNTNHPELGYSVHQCEIFRNDPRHSHEQVAKDIIRYQINTRMNPDDKTKYQGLLTKIVPSKSVVYYMDASFAGD